jgi:hypothetical protein
MKYSDTITKEGYYEYGEHTSSNTLWVKEIPYPAAGTSSFWVYVIQTYTPCFMRSDDSFSLASHSLMPGTSPIAGTFRGKITIPKDYSIDSLKYLISSSSQCSHEYISYTGLFESFEFCKKCDHKKA